MRSGCGWGERPCVVGAVPGRDGAPADHAGPGVARGRVPPVAAVLGFPIRPDAAAVSALPGVFRGVVWSGDCSHDPGWSLVEPFCPTASGSWWPAGSSSPGAVRMNPPDPAGCPYCDAATGVTRVACDSPKVQAWSCAACGGRWWFSAVTPWHYLERLAGEVVLRKVAALVEEAPGLSDGQLWARLITVLAALDQHAKTCPGEGMIRSLCEILRGTVPLPGASGDEMLALSCRNALANGLLDWIIYLLTVTYGRVPLLSTRTLYSMYTTKP
jgi:hypothetical protein